MEQIQPLLAEASPRIWVLIGEKLGDNAQVLRAADAMSIHYEIRRIVVRPEFRFSRPAVRASLDHVDIANSDQLEAPWPDLVITIGRRLSMVALWVKQQSEGKSRIALFNAPKGLPRDFDVLVLPAYYRTLGHSSICRIALPLVMPDLAKIDGARRKFGGSIGRMAKPLIVILLGGSTGNLQLNVSIAREIVESAQAMHREGSVFVSTSRRTAPAIADEVARILRPMDRFYRWTAGDEANPYYGLLAHGDRFIVTGDSISMIVEIIRLGRPLAVVELPRVNAKVLRALRALGLREPGPAVEKLLAWATSFQPRDFDNFYFYLYEQKLASRFGEPFHQSVDLPQDDVKIVADCLRALASIEHANPIC